MVAWIDRSARDIGLVGTGGGLVTRSAGSADVFSKKAISQNEAKKISDFKGHPLGQYAKPALFHGAASEFGTARACRASVSILLPKTTLRYTWWRSCARNIDFGYEKNLLVALSTILFWTRPELELGLTDAVFSYVSAT